MKAVLSQSFPARNRPEEEANGGFAPMRSGLHTHFSAVLSCQLNHDEVAVRVLRPTSCFQTSLKNMKVCFVAFDASAWTFQWTQAPSRSAGQQLMALTHLQQEVQPTLYRPRWLVPAGAADQHRCTNTARKKNLINADARGLDQRVVEWSQKMETFLFSFSFLLSLGATRIPQEEHLSEGVTVCSASGWSCGAGSDLWLQGRPGGSASNCSVVEKLTGALWSVLQLLFLPFQFIREQPFQTDGVLAMRRARAAHWFSHRRAPISDTSGDALKVEKASTAVA